MTFCLSQESLEEFLTQTREQAPTVGGLVTFEGRVRNINEGMMVISLEYEAYIPLAQLEGEKILKEAREKFGVVSLFCAHRVGHLQIRDLAVWVMAAGVHRQEAFLACEYVINEIKKRLPIWKKEYYLEKEAQWVACPSCATHENHET